MDNIVVVRGTASNGIAEEISSILNVPMIGAEYHILADGESYVRIPEKVSGKIVILVQSTYPPQDKHLIELFLLMDAIKSYNPKKIILIVPYLAYLRQNKRFKEGEPISADIMLKMIKNAGADALVTIEPHRPESLVVFGGKSMIADPLPAYVAAVPKGLKKAVVLSPDNGGLQRAERFAKLLGTPFTSIDKERDKTTGKIYIKSESTFDFKNRDVIIIDDVISTGGTVAQAAKFVKSEGANKVLVIAAHLIMVGNCGKKIKNAGVSSITGLNTVPSKGTRVVDASRILTESIEGILRLNEY